jgi:hypothetical protein
MMNLFHFLLKSSQLKIVDVIDFARVPVGGTDRVLGLYIAIHDILIYPPVL